MHVILEVSYNTHVGAKCKLQDSYSMLISKCKCMCVLECIYMGVDTYSYVNV